MRRVQDFDELFAENTYPGEILVFGVLVQGNPSNKFLIRSMASTGDGIIKKTFKYLAANGGARAVTGLGGSKDTGIVHFAFLGIVGKGSLSAYRKAWYRHYSRIAEICYGRGQHTARQLLKLLDDKSVQFQLSYSLDSLQIESNNATQAFYDLLERESLLRGALDRASLQNWPSNQVAKR